MIADAMNDKASRITMWLFLLLGIILVILRLSLRTLSRNKFTHGDFWCLTAGVFTLARLIANDYLLLYGSTRVISVSTRQELKNPAYKDVYDKVVMGSKLILMTRSFLMLALWSCKLAVVDLIAKLIIAMPWEKKVMRLLYIGLALGFVTSLVPVYVECRPFKKFWQINPAPGKCVIGNVWIVQYEMCNILTDIMLMTVPLIVVFSVPMTLVQRLRLSVLFSIGLFLIATSMVRVKQGYNSWLQDSQTIWASMELFLAVVVAVTPTIFGLIHNGGKPQTWRTSIPLDCATTKDETERDSNARPVSCDAKGPPVWNELNKKDTRHIEEA